MTVSAAAANTAREMPRRSFPTAKVTVCRAGGRPYIELAVGVSEAEAAAAGTARPIAARPARPLILGAPDGRTEEGPSPSPAGLWGETSSVDGEAGGRDAVWMRWWAIPWFPEPRLGRSAVAFEAEVSIRVSMWEWPR